MKTDATIRKIKHRGGQQHHQHQQRNDIEAAVDVHPDESSNNNNNDNDNEEEAEVRRSLLGRGFMNDDDHSDNNNSHSSKELKIRSSAAWSANSKNLILVVVTTVMIVFGTLSVLQQRPGGASSFLGSSTKSSPSKPNNHNEEKESSATSSSYEETSITVPPAKSTSSNTNLMIPPASSMTSAAAAAGGSIISGRVRRTLQITTWNIAAINNNPFEYWITYPNEPAYERLMVALEEWIEHPTTNDRDVSVAAGGVFTQSMFERLDARLTGTAGWKSMKHYWDDDYSKRTIVTQFLKDRTLGDKRLASMPDRVTNIINTANGTSVYRPSVISMFDGDLSTQETWWSAWEKFMFDTPLDIKDPKSGIVAPMIPYAMLQKISKSKYPSITETEEADSLPLQTLCGAIFDAILVYMMNTLSSSSTNNNYVDNGVAVPTVPWQTLKRTMVENLNQKKIPHTLDILQNTHYLPSDVITLQEVSSAFVTTARATPALSETFHIVTGADADPVRDQNSVIFLRKSTFDITSVVEITATVKSHLPPKPRTDNGDILCLTVKSRDSTDQFVICSFHGDTDGLLTIPVTDAVAKTVQDAAYRDHYLIFGLDANTYENVDDPTKRQPVKAYAERFASLGLTSCWGEPYSNPSNYTTYNARTYLQTQLNKACKSTEKRIKGDVNPKDFILFRKHTEDNNNSGRSPSFFIRETWKDNTGGKSYTEDMAFPTLDFPSDHGLLATVLEIKD